MSDNVKTEKKITFKPITKIIICALALVLAVVTILLVFFGGGASSVPYVKNNQLYVGGKQITTQFLDDWYEEHPNRLPQLESFNKIIKTSEYGNTVYYPEKYMEADDYTLYCRTDNGSPKKVADSAIDYQISADGKTVAYRDKDDVLFISDIKSFTKIEKGVTSFKLSKDGNRLLYLSGSSLYLKEGSQPSRLLTREINAGSVDYITKTDENFDTVYFLSNIPVKKGDEPGTNGFLMYVCTDGKNVTQVGDNAAGPLNWYYFKETGEIYYLASEGYKYHYYTDYLVNDLGVDGEEKLESMKGSGTNVSIYSLWRCDGEKSKKIASNIDICYSGVKDGKVSVVFKQYKTVDIEKLPLSKAETTKTVDEHIQSIYKCFVNQSITSNGKTSVLSEIDQPVAAITDDKVYFCDVRKNFVSGTFYVAEFKDGKAQTPRQIDNVRLCHMVGDSVVYIKDNDLYIDDKKIAEKVMSIGTYTDKNGDEQLYCLTDYEQGSALATLTIYKDGKLITVDKNVNYSRIGFVGDDVVYIKNYDVEKRAGDLYLYSNGKAKKISSDVYTFISND